MLLFLCPAWDSLSLERKCGVEQVRNRPSRRCGEWNEESMAERLEIASPEVSDRSLARWFHSWTKTLWRGEVDQGWLNLATSGSRSKLYLDESFLTWVPNNSQKLRLSNKLTIKHHKHQKYYKPSYYEWHSAETKDLDSQELEILELSNIKHRKSISQLFKEIKDAFTKRRRLQQRIFGNSAICF